MNDVQEHIACLRERMFEREDNKTEYMSDMDRWVCVHTTDYDPEQNSDGKLAIKTTAMATDYKMSRATVHVTLNQIVASNGGGNWDKASIVILAPYKDVVAVNGNPQEIATEDTYFIPDPDKGLVLPDSTYIVRGDPHSEKLFEIGEHEATYKTGNYTDEEVEAILTLNPGAKYEYEQYLDDDISDNTVDYLLGYDKKLVDIYKNSKDKKSFLKGILDEDRFAVLNRILRESVVRMSMKKMGYHYVNSHEDETSGIVADVANAAGIKGQSGNKGHSLSLEAELEDTGCFLASMSDVLKGKNIDEIYEYLTESRNPMSAEIVKSILSDTPVPDAYKSYVKTFNDYVDNAKDYISYRSFCTPAENERDLKHFEMMGRRGLRGYNARLDTVLRRQAKKMNGEYTAALKELKNNPKEYAELKTRLTEFERNRALNIQYRGSSIDR